MTCQFSVGQVFNSQSICKLDPFQKLIHCLTHLSSLYNLTQHTIEQSIAISDTYESSSFYILTDTTIIFTSARCHTLTLDIVGKSFFFSSTPLSLHKDTMKCTRHTHSLKINTERFWIWSLRELCCWLHFSVASLLRFKEDFLQETIWYVTKGKAQVK